MCYTCIRYIIYYIDMLMIPVCVFTKSMDRHFQNFFLVCTRRCYSYASMRYRCKPEKYSSSSHFIKPNQLFSPILQKLTYSKALVLHYYIRLPRWPKYNQTWNSTYLKVTRDLSSRRCFIRQC